MNEVTPEVLEAELMPVAKKAESIVVRNNDEHVACVAYLQDNKRAQARIHEVIDPIVESAHAAHKQATALRNRLLDPFLKGESHAKAVDRDYQNEQERIRQAEQARLQAIEAERARKEREKQEAAARILREKEQAAQREADEARRMAEREKNSAKRLELQKEAEARQAAATAAAAKAEAREEKAAAVVKTVVHVERTVEASAASVKKTWKARVTDIALVPREYMVVNDAALQAFARAVKGQVRLPGVEMFEDSSLSVRTK